MTVEEITTNEEICKEWHEKDMTQMICEWSEDYMNNETSFWFESGNGPVYVKITREPVDQTRYEKWELPETSAGLIV